MLFPTRLRNRTSRRASAGRSRPRLEALDDRALPATFYAANAADLIADIKAAHRGVGADTIVLTSPTTSPYDLVSVDNNAYGGNGLPVIAKNDSLTIVGNGDTIKRNTAAGTPRFRLFDVAAGGSLTLQNLTLQNGFENGAGGAINNQGTLVLSQVTVQNNTAVGAPATGGGVWSKGSFTATDSTFAANVAENDFNGPAYGGGVYIAGGTADITGSAFGNPDGGGGNTAEGRTAYGGAVYVAAGKVALSGDTFGNVNPLSGAGNGNFALGGFGTTAQDNGYGGAVCVAGGSVTLTNDMIEGNGVADLNNPDGGAFGDHGGYGGGIYIATKAAVSIDSFTVGHTFGNSSNYPTDIDGSYKLLP